MNDPGLEGPIANASSEVHDAWASESTPTLQEDGRKRSTVPHTNSHNKHHYQSPAYSKPGVKGEDVTHELPTRWWYASTGFPLIAGTFGPMANAFSICALVENWRVQIPPGGTEEHGIDIRDPRWLVAVNAVSLVCALIANLCLLLNMAKRMPFRWAQPVTILGFWISSVLLIVLIGIAANDLRAPGVEHQALTQAYYYACWAAGLYQIISLMMCVTVYGALTHKYSSDFNLTMAQRTLMLQTIAFLAYLLIGALVYTHIEGWKFLDAVYWSDFTLLTVGMGGDMTPTTHLGRSLLFPFSIGGIVTLGLVISSIRSMIIDRGKRKLHARMTEKMRRRLVRQVEEIYEAGKAKRRKVTGLKKDLVRRLTLDPAQDPDNELDRRRAEFEAMRMVEELTRRRQKWTSLVLSTTAFAALWFVGAVVFWVTEGQNQGWSYFIALYFSWTSLLTIGYGDYVPLSNPGRSFYVFWSLLAVPSLTILISDMGDTVVKGVKDLTIWVGEVTILPSNQGTVLERLRYGLQKTLGVQASTSRNIRDAEDSAGNTSKEDKSIFQHPGLVKLFKFPRSVFGESQTGGSTEEVAKDLEVAERSDENEPTDRVARNFEEAKQQDENEARHRDGLIAEDEHHYRRILIAEIRKLYAHSNLATPKCYTYDEWAYFLRLLGEDESSSDFHDHARIKSPRRNDHRHDTTQTHTDGSEQFPEQSVSQWSWIGSRSPLMTRGDRSESEWLILRLFERLEESLLNAHHEKERHVRADLNHTSSASNTASGCPASRRLDHQPQTQVESRSDPR